MLFDNLMHFYISLLLPWGKKHFKSTFGSLNFFLYLPKCHLHSLYSFSWIGCIYFLTLQAKFFWLFWESRMLLSAILWYLLLTQQKNWNNVKKYQRLETQKDQRLKSKTKDQMNQRSKITNNTKWSKCILLQF